MLKTFWGGESGWRDEQLDDGTVIWTAPDGRQYITTPGSRLLFPELSKPTATVVATQVPRVHTAGITMPRRKTTRAQDRARRVERERELNGPVGIGNDADNASTVERALPVTIASMIRG